MKAISVLMGDKKARFGADLGRQLDSNSIDFQSTVMHGRFLMATKCDSLRQIQRT
jgi:hypothetical protein